MTTMSRIVRLAATCGVILALGAGLSACRSNKCCPPQNAPVANNCPPSCAPVCPPSCAPVCPPACPPSYAGAPGNVYRVPSPPAPSGSFGSEYGSPDAGLAYGGGQPSGGFPAPSPVPMRIDDRTFEDNAQAIANGDQVIGDLRSQIDELRRKIDEPAQPVTALAPAEGGNEVQARTFASALRAANVGEVEQNGGVVIVRVSDAFQSGSEKLKAEPGIRTTLLATAEALQRSPGARVEVVGHSDSEPIRKSSWPDNITLSRARAQTVANTLVRHGVPSGTVAVDGRGAGEPLVYPERSKQDRARNRRVEVHVNF